jgi:CHAT domain-containing protein/tetratricopeptide (TPR) repeat protein
MSRHGDSLGPVSIGVLLIGVAGLVGAALAEARSGEPSASDASAAVREAGQPLATAADLHAEAVQLQKEGRLAEAEKLLREALAIREKHSPDSLEVAASLHNLAGITQSLHSDFATAKTYLERALEIRKRLAPDSLEVASSLYVLGRVARKQNDFAAARAYHERALAIQQMLAPGSRELAWTLMNLGTDVRLVGDLPGAGSYYERALALFEELEPDGREVAQCFQNIALVAADRGDFARYDDYMGRALAILEKRYPGSRGVAVCLSNLGLNAYRQGDLVTAKQYLARARTAYTQLTTFNDHRHLSFIFEHLGLIAEAQGDFAKAKDYYERSLGIREKHMPDSHWVAEILEWLGNVHLQQGNLPAAKDHYERALDIWMRHAPDKVWAAVALNNLAIVARAQGDLAAAMDYHERALAIGEKHAPASDIVVGTLYELARTNRARGDLEAAKRSWERALAIMDRINPDSLEAAEGLRGLGLLMRDRGDLVAAEPLFDRAWKIVMAGRRAVTGDEAGRAFVASKADYASDLVRLRLDRNKPVDAFRTLEEGRAQVLLQLLSERGLDRSGIAPELWRAYESAEHAFLRAGKDLASASAEEGRLEREADELRSANAEETALAAKRNELATAAQRREKALATYTRTRIEKERLLGEIRHAMPGLEPSELSFDEARAALPADSIFVAWSLAEEDGAVFVIPGDPQGPIGAHRLAVGETQLAERIASLREQIGSGPVVRGIGGLSPSEEELASADDALVTESRALFEALFPAEVRPAIGAAKRIIVSPDGPLWELPFAALVTNADDEPEWLGVAKPLSYIPSLTVLAFERGNEPTAAPSTGEVVVVGDPIFARAPQPEGDGTTESAALQVEPETTMRGERVYLAAGGVPPEPLPASGEEARRVAALYGCEPLLGEAATESAVRRKLSSASVVHLATHGYFHPHLAMSSGVLLTPAEGEAGANATDNDGALQAWEFGRTLPLHADLVVLSACETGRGEKVRGEGLVGMTRALQGAGARSVVATHWKVADESTAELMVSFHEKLRAGLPKDAALREAMATTAAEPETSHPFYWAPFFLTGDPSSPVRLEAEPPAPEASERVQSILAEVERSLDEEEYETARRLIDDAIRVAGREEDRPLAAADVLGELGRQLASRNHLAEAERLHREALAIREKHAPDSLQVASSLHHLAGVVEKLRSDHATAKEYLERALEIRERLAPESLEVASSLYVLGRLLRKQSDFPAATACHERALAIQQKLAPESRAVARTLQVLGTDYRIQGDLSRAEAYHGRALALYEKLAPGSLSVAWSLEALAIDASFRGDLDRATALTERVLEIRQKHTPGSHGVAICHNNLGFDAYRRGDLVEAKQYFERAATIFSKDKTSKGYRLHATSLVNLGMVAETQGDLAKAKDYYERSRALLEKQLPDSPWLAEVLDNLGDIQLQRGNLVAAKELYQRSLGTWQRSAPDALGVASPLYRLGVVARAQDDLAAAEDYHERALAIREKHAPGSDEVARSLYELARTSRGRGALQVSKRYWERALEIMERINPDSLEVAEGSRGLGLLVREQGDLAAAEPLLDRAWKIVTAGRRAVTGDEAGRAFVASKAGYASDLVRLQLDRNKPADAFRTLEEGRAQVLLQLLSERGMDRSGIAPELWQAYESAEHLFLRAGKDLAAATAEEAQLKGKTETDVDALAKAGAKREEVLAVYTRARIEKERLLGEIRHAVPGLEPGELSLDEARAALPADSVFVAWSLAEEDGAVFVIPGDPQRSIEAHRLSVGETQLADRIATLREQIGSGPIVRGIGGLSASTEDGAADEDALVTESRALFEDLFPVEARPTIEAAERIIVSPDGPLWELPFAALVTNTTGEPEWLGVARPLSYTPSLTVLAFERGTESSTGTTIDGVVVVGDPVFAGAPAGYEATESAAVGTSSTTNLRGERAYLAAGGVQPEPLPASGEEARRVAGLYGCDGCEAMVGDAATERAVRDNLSRASVVHLATHGYFHPHLAMSSGVLLAPDEQRPGAGDTEIDGALQAWEFGRTLPLRADLVVLSACETGRGERVRGEGLVGLTRALQGAGAKSVVATHWKVADESTAELMVSFHEKLRAGLSKDEALRGAMAETATRAETSHPFYWAPFFLTGDPDSPLRIAGEPPGPTASAPVRSILQEAELFLGDEEPEQALSATDRALALAADNGDAAGRALAHVARARVLASLDRTEEALAAWQEAENEWGKLGAVPERAEALLARAALLLGRDDEDAAQRLIDEAIRAASREPNRPLAAADALYLAGRELKWGSRHLAESKRLFEESLTIREEHAPDSLAVADSLQKLGAMTYAMRRDFDVAEDYYLRALAIREKLDPESLDTAGNLSRLGFLAVTRGNLAEGRRYHERGLAMREKLAPGSVAEAASLEGLGIAIGTGGDLATAKEYYERALAIQERLAPNSTSTATSLNNLGYNAFRRGDLVTARTCHERALAIYEKRNPGSLSVALSFMNIGLIAEVQGDVTAAKDYYERVLAIRERYMPDSIEVAEALDSLGNIQLRQGNLVAAKDLYERAFAINEKHTPGSHWGAMMLDNLGRIARSQGDLAAARAYHERSLKRNQKHVPGSPEVVRSLYELARTARAQGELRQAKGFWERALTIVQEQSPGSLAVARGLGGLGQVDVDLGDLASAEALYDEAWTIVREQRRAVTGDEADRAFAVSHIDFAGRLVRIRLDRGKPLEALHTLEEARAQGLLQLLSERGLDQSGVDPELWREYAIAEQVFLKAGKDLAAATAGEARLKGNTEAETDALATARTKREEALAVYTRARLEKQRLLGEIRHAVPGLEPSELSFDEARTALPADSVFVSWSLAEEDGVIFVIPSDRERPVEAHRLDVGEVQLGERIAALRGQIGSSSVVRGIGGLSAAEEEQAAARDALVTESRELFEALFPAEARSAIETAERVILSPDGPLWELPFAALVTNETGGPQWLGIERRLSYTPSLTVLASEEKAGPSSAPSPTEVVVVGDPVFARVPAGDGTTEIAAVDVSSTTKLRGERTYLAAEGVLPEPLPASGDEARRVAALYGCEPMLGEAATEHAVREKLPTASVIHLATHGYFHPQLAMSSGVLLTPAEQEPGVSETDNDGALQAWEFGRTLPLSADLVVLSACETGRGEKVRGEGLVGLTRALQGAGARSVVATHWKVADESTAELMVSFHAKLRAGLSKDEALRKAMAETAANPETSHPFFWAPFFLTGDPDSPLRIAGDGS